MPYGVENAYGTILTDTGFVNGPTKSLTGTAVPYTREAIAMSEGGRERLEVGDRFYYEPKDGDAPYLSGDDVPDRETHEVVEIRDSGEVLTERVDDDSRQKFSWGGLEGIVVCDTGNEQ